LKIFKNQRTPGFGFGGKKRVQNEITVSSWFLLQSFKEPASFPKKVKDWQFRACSVIGSLISLELWFQGENGSFDFLVMVPYTQTTFTCWIVSLQKRELPNTGSYPIRIVSRKL
jgi:hypothetical protein